jgi:iron complex outermembrane recepter protein
MTILKGRTSMITKPHIHLSILNKAVLSALLLSSTHGAIAQTQTTTDDKKTEKIIVIGNPLAATDARDVVSPVELLSGNDLLLKRANTLGETVNGLLGVSSTWFGPNAGRPVIRGLDGDRVRVLTNLGASFDASSLSFDHNPAIDPLAIERVEVLRGPATLLYGGTAIGGVVNVIDNRIPSTAVNGVRGVFEMRGGGADRERGTSALVEAGNGVFSIHADAFDRRTGDYRVPASTNIVSPIVNSSADARGGALGVSLALLNGRGNMGISHSRYDSNYGTVAEADVRIDMRQSRTAAELNLRDLGGEFINGLFVKAAQSDYQHTEFEGVEVGTVFKNKGSDVRAEIKHIKFGSLEGVIGLQAETFRFSALGDEAFVPKTRTRNQAVFLYEELTIDKMRYAFGARWEKSRVNSEGAADNAPTRFGNASSRDFSLGSVSLGGRYLASRDWTINANVAINERAPTYYELYADGPHVATGAYEISNTRLNKERANSFDVGASWAMNGDKNGTRAKLNLFQQSFRDFVALRRTGVDRDTEGNRGATDCGDGTSVESTCTAEILPEYGYQAVAARLRGIEAEAVWQIVKQPYTLALTAKIDSVRADDKTNREPLPRIAPHRTTLGIDYTWQGINLSTSATRHAKQSRVPTQDSLGSTAGYTLWRVSAQYNFAISPLGKGTNASVFITGNNLTNARAFNAASIDTIRNLAPLAGRSVKAGVRLDF